MSGFLDDIPDLKIGGHKKSRQKTPLPEPENIVVLYIRTQCPNCKSFKVPVYNTNYLPIRYHKCADCGLCFKSVEDTNENTKNMLGM